MSHIAAALAKSKGKEVKPPPLESFPDTSGLSEGTPPMPQSFPGNDGKARERKLRLIVIGGAIVLTLGVLLIVKLRSSSATPPPQAKPVAAAPKVATPEAPAPAPQSKAEPQPAKATVAAAATTPAAPAPAPAPAKAAPAAPVAPAAEPAVIQPSEETLALVRKFSISAVMSGPNGRARIDGKTYQVGDTVLPGLDLVEIKDGQVFFRDTAGATYSRRF